ncbi:hypothetical protein M8818_002982 [Zalaria obscura]|uniref:Uncharacterized protein n=1 Tax=Zalaria obscura TaxID=2024903 RepID=A0ACC3SGL3_9PEZI
MSLQEYEKTWEFVAKPAPTDAKDQIVPQVAVQDTDAVIKAKTEASPIGPPLVTKSRKLRKPKQQKERFQNYAAILRRRLNYDGRHVSTKLEIKSPFLRAALSSILKNHDRLNVEADPLILAEPYESLFHQRAALEELFTALKTNEEKEELNLIRDFVDVQHEVIHAEYKRNDGSLPITALSIYPLKFHPKHEELKKALEDRGSKYAQIVNGRVMIDYAQYIKHCPPAAVQFAGAMGIDVTDEDAHERRVTFVPRYDFLNCVCSAEGPHQSRMNTSVQRQAHFSPIRKDDSAGTSSPPSSHKAQNHVSCGAARIVTRSCG